MKITIPLFSALYYYYKLFVYFTKHRLFILFSFVLCGGIVEGLGISTVIPLINFENRSEDSDRYSEIIYDFLEFIGFGASLSSILMLVICLFSVKAVFLIFQYIYSAKISTVLNEELKKKFCIKYVNVKYDYFMNKSIGFFNNIITTEVGTTIAGLNNFIRVIICMVYIGVYLLAAFLLNPTLTTLVVVIAIIIFISLRNVNKYILKLSYLVTQTNAELQSLTIQKLYNHKYLKATNSFAPIINKLFTKIEENRKYQFITQVVNSIPPSFIEIISVISMSLIIWYYVGYQGRKIGEIIVLLIFFWRALNKLLNFQNWWQRFCSFAGSINVVNDAYKDLDQNVEKFGTATAPTLKDKIELQNITFSYNSKKVIDNVNIIIPQGKSVGIVGPSGAGKTTLFDLLVGLFSPKSGVIKIDETRYQDIDLKGLRSNIGYVTQEPVIFNDTIANNISFWNCDNKNTECMKKIKYAAESANCSSFIEECENGYETVIGEKGVKLSGGQRQRIAIAREIFKDPKIMIFDEATSALDSESERLIQESINSMKGKYTLIIIAHRLSTILNCDLVYVLNNGRIVENGAISELYERKDSIFYQMCLKQSMTISNPVK